MIRLNVFFTLKEDVCMDDVLALTNELVAKSREDEGNKGY
ncbi:MAG: antibiotic biosynthesis monooxygenase, partial [Bacteroides sp.]|nr:antibiotic biosynthesis monooxygenase [Bacteroides sp.]